MTTDYSNVMVLAVVSAIELIEEYGVIECSFPDEVPNLVFQHIWEEVREISIPYLYRVQRGDDRKIIVVSKVSPNDPLVGRTPTPYGG